MVHAVSGNLQVPGKALGKARPYKQGSHEPRACGIGDGIDVGELDAGFLDGGFGDGGNLLQVRPCGDFWNHASVEGVLVNLAVKGVRKYLQGLILQNGAGSFVAARFDTEPEHYSSSPRVSAAAGAASILTSFTLSGISS